MTREEKERLLAEIEKEYKWLMTKSPTIYMMDIAFDAIRKAVRDEASKELEEPTISLEAYKQVTKERDIAIEQLHELGYEFGEKIEPTTKNCGSCRYYGSHHEVCNYCYKCSLWTEQEATTKNDLGVDCISRIETIDYLCKHCPDDGECFKDCDEITHLRQMPSVTPQEPFINKSCISTGVCEHDKNKVLDKIRAEIETDLSFFCFDDWGNETTEWKEVKAIIDKYKAESEEEE